MARTEISAADVSNVEDTAPSTVEELQTTLDITNTLLSAISSTDPVRTLASRVGVLCKGTAVIYDFEGAVIASTGEAPTQLIWNEVSSTNQRELSVEIGRWHVRTRRVALRQGIHVLAIASRGLDTIEAIGEQLLDISERLLGAAYGIQQGASRRDRRDNEQLLASLHDGILPSREHRFWSRLGQFRFPAYTRLRALEFAPFDAESADESHAMNLFTRARSDDLPILISLRRTDIDSAATVSALVQDTKRSELWITEVSNRMLVGASAPFSALAQVPASVHEAETALGIARSRAAVLARPEKIGAILIDDIDLTTWLLSHVDRRQLTAHIDQLLEPLRESALLDTLITYLAAEQNIGVTASALFVHANTVRYRLTRIEEILGCSIASAPTVTNLVLALYPEILGQAEALRQTEDPGADAGLHVSAEVSADAPIRQSEKTH